MTSEHKYFELKKMISDYISSHGKADRELMITVLIESAVELASQRQGSDEIDLVNDLIDETLSLFYRARDIQNYKQKSTLRSAAVL